jgi:murein DD-endopeptidase MepM/ murein hydrolase activator NlpD
MNRRRRYIRIPRDPRAWRLSPGPASGGVGSFDLLAPLEALFVTSPFGSRSAPTSGASTNHKGIDYRAPVGTPVFAASDGTVLFAGVQSGYGNVVVIDHGGGVQTKYAHLSSIDVSPGASLVAGEQLGASGQSGNVTGPHLHFELDVNGVPVDPSSSIMASSLSSVVPGSTPSPFESDDTSVLPDLGGDYGVVDPGSIVDDISSAVSGNPLEVGLLGGLVLFGLWVAWR